MDIKIMGIDTHVIEVALAIASPSKGNRTKFLLDMHFTDFGLPTAYLGEQESTIEVAARLLDRFTGLKALVAGLGWIHLWPQPLADSVERKVNGVRVITVPYGCLIPETRGHKSGEWFTLSECVERGLYMDHLEILKVVSHHLARR